MLNTLQKKLNEISYYTKNYYPGMTPTASALKSTLENFKESGRFNDTSTVKTLLLVTDGKLVVLSLLDILSHVR